MMIPLSELFDIRYGHSLELNRLKLLNPAEGGIPFVSRKMGDNGISAYVAPIEGVEPAQGGQLSCALSGNGVLSTFLHEVPFYSGFHVAHLSPKTEMTKQQLLYYCACLVANRYRYSYGRQANRTLKNILVPSLVEIPDYVAEVDVDQFSGCDSPRSFQTVSEIQPATWLYYRLEDLFDIRKGQRLTKANMLPGNLPYIGASDTFNGVTARIGQRPIHEGGTISVSYNGSVAEAFYQPVPFWATDDVNVLYPKFEMSPSVAMFLCAVIRREKYRYNYGRKWHLERMRETLIKLPSAKDGKPEWEYMENYINTLPLSSQLESRSGVSP